MHFVLRLRLVCFKLITCRAVLGVVDVGVSLSRVVHHFHLVVEKLHVVAHAHLHNKQTRNGVHVRIQVVHLHRHCAVFLEHLPL